MQNKAGLRHKSSWGGAEEEQHQLQFVQKHLPGMLETLAVDSEEGKVCARYNLPYCGTMKFSVSCRKQKRAKRAVVGRWEEAVHREDDELQLHMQECAQIDQALLCVKSGWHAFVLARLHWSLSSSEIN